MSRELCSQIHHARGISRLYIDVGKEFHGLLSFVVYVYCTATHDGVSNNPPFYASQPRTISCSHHDSGFAVCFCADVSVPWAASCRGLLPWGTFLAWAAAWTSSCLGLLPWATRVLLWAAAVMRRASSRRSGLFAEVAGAEQHLPLLPKRAAVVEYGGGKREEGEGRSGRGRIVARLLRLNKAPPVAFFSVNIVS